MLRSTLRAAFPVACLVPLCAAAAQVQTNAPPPEVRTGARAETVTDGLVHPWGLAFLPDGRMLVTERPGRLRIVAGSGRLGPAVPGVPAVSALNQGGLLDVAIDPEFARSGLVYLTFSEPRAGGGNGTSVARGRLVTEDERSRLEDVRVIFRQQPATGGGLHFGSRLAFAPDGRLFVTLGERYQKEHAQNLARHYGKVVRIAPDGSVPPDNPFVGRRGALPEIWSYGHRNPQSAAINPATGRLWTVEHGARGGDEINIPEAGRNYGWPVITYGIDYSGARIGEGQRKAGMEQPIYYWDPSIAPSGMAFYTGDRFPAWQGNLFVGALKDRMLVRLVIAGDRVVAEERLLEDLGERIRDVRQGPDGALYVLTDSRQGRLLRVTPAN
ncbi:MAG: PQQ-dependent sugar dehydrogenase [Hyphomicrobiaceae bacterium]